MRNRFVLLFGDIAGRIGFPIVPPRSIAVERPSGGLDSAIEKQLGAGSFDSSKDTSWEVWLSNDEEDMLTNGLRDTWNHIHKSIQDSKVPGENVDLTKLLIGQPIVQVGRLPDGSSPPSVTKRATKEIEALRGKHIRHVTKNIARDHPERKVLECVDTMSRIFLHSPIDPLGYLDNPTFHLTSHRYLGLPCPLLQGYQGYKFGKDGTEVDVMRAKLGSAALPGGGFFPLHNNLQSYLEQCL